MATKPIVLVLGAGSNIGKALALKFSSIGYSVALASRSTPDGTTLDGHFGVKVDLSDPSSIATVFEKVKSALGAPNTIIYNAANVSAPPDPNNLFSLPLDTLEKDVNIMSNSAFAAAKEAVAGFETLPKGLKKTFIYTGNILAFKVLPVPSLVTLGIGKSAAAYWIGLASSSFKDKGYGSVYFDALLVVFS
jgi:NAD(P)-dependent dehydrogenase (short-subunit alcohol dehydrogenase family)